MSTTRPNLFATGVAVFAGVMLLTTALFQALQGLAAILEDEVFIEGVEYTYEFDVTAWGWIHLILGLIGIAVGIGILGAQTWALVAGIALAVLGALSQFLFLPYYPFWALLILAMYVVVIWALGEQLSRSS